MLDFAIYIIFVSAFVAIILVYIRHQKDKFTRKQTQILRGGKPSYVYFMTDKSGDIKIGRAIDVDNRFKQFKTGNRSIKLLAYYEETPDFNETLLHRRFKKQRRSKDSEWFEPIERIKYAAQNGNLIQLKWYEQFFG